MLPQIFTIKTFINRCYLIKDKGMILVDAGYLKSLPDFKKAFEKSGIDPSEIKLIIITHGHFDHMGCATELKKLTGARIVVHAGDINYFERTEFVPPPGTSRWGRLMAWLMRPFFKWAQNQIIPQKADIVLGNEDFPLHDLGINGRIVHTPGHTPGHISVLLDSGEAFVGCMAHNNFPFRVGPGLPIFGENIEKIKESWQKVFDSGAKIIYPGHGNAFRTEVMAKKLHWKIHTEP